MFAPLRGVKLHKLSNGLRVYLKQDRQWPLVSAHAWVNVGSIDEDDADAGISHVLEHMVFKGTTHHKAAEISRWVEALGGSINAETAKEYTHYYIDVPAAGAPKAVHLLAELLYRATFDPAEWDRECPVILEEIKRRNDDPEALLWDLLNEALFDDVRRKRPVIGYPETVARIQIGALKQFYGRHYTAQRSVLVVAGDFDLKHMLLQLEKEFKDMPRGEVPVPRAHAAVPGSARTVGHQKPVQQAYWGFGFPTPPASHGDHEVLDLLATILGEGRRSRLVQTLREDQKLVWSISAANMTHEGPGLFAIFAECDLKKRHRLRPAIETLLRDLRRHPPTATELTRAKNIIQTAWLQGFETYHNQASTIGLFAIEDHLRRLQRYLPRVLAVTGTQVRRVVERYFSLPMASAVIEA